jgi:hypothetical protein
MSNVTNAYSERCLRKSKSTMAINALTVSRPTISSTLHCSFGYITRRHTGRFFWVSRLGSNLKEAKQNTPFGRRSVVRSCTNTSTAIEVNQLARPRLSWSACRIGQFQDCRFRCSSAGHSLFVGTSHFATTNQQNHHLSRWLPHEGSSTKWEYTQIS